LQHADNRRLREARQRARSRVEALLGLVEIPSSTQHQQQQTLPDPFGEPERKGSGQRRKFSSPITASHHGASVQDRAARATRFKLYSDIASNTETTHRIQCGLELRRKRLAERHRDLDRRKLLLEQAASYVRHSIEANSGLDLLSHEVIASLKARVDDLQAQGREVASSMAKARATLAREAFSLFNVCAPSSSLASARNISSRNKAAPIPSRSQRSKERYSTAGAFAIDFTSAFDLGKSARESKAKEEVGNVNDWTILGLVLPLPSDLRRFERAEINGAVSHTIQLLQLVTTYLGVTLPFVISIHGNMPQIRANPLWGAGAKETLHLSSSVHSALIASGGSNTGGGLGGSMMSSLGASTLSTIESFVQLPSAKNLPWAKTFADPSPKGQAKGQMSRVTETGGPPEDAANLEGKRFCYALTMLSYDVAYLAHLQGVKIDLVMAAGSVLRLLSKAMQSPDLGKRSHTAHQSSHNASHVQFAAIDFAQLLQIHEPGSRHTIDSLGKHSSSKTIMEGSYVDARKAAESILDLRKIRSTSIATAPPPAPAPLASVRALAPKAALPKVATSTQTKEKLSSLAAKRFPSTLPVERVPKVQSSSGPAAKVTATAASPANTLDFLKTKGQSSTSKKASEAGKEGKTVQINASLPAASGTIIFNGKEIRGKTKNSTSKGDKSKPDEEGWHVL
jgi:urease gamma subunit